MTVSIQDLREKRAAKAKEARQLLNDHPGDKWTPVQGDAFTKLEAEISQLETQIGAHQRMLDIEADGKAGAKLIEAAGRAGLANADQLDPRRMYDTWLRGGDNALSSEQWAAIRATMSTTTPSEGGYTVSTTVAGNLIDALKTFGGMRQVAEVFRTAKGNDWTFPTSDGTAEVGEIVAQNAPASAQDPVFGTVALSVYKYSSKVVAVPFELLQDSEIDVEAFVQQRLRTRIGRITNQHFTTGTGSGQPRGAVTAATVGKVGTTGQTTTVTYNDMVDLIHSLDPAYRGMSDVAWMMADISIKGLRKLVDSAGRPIWTPGYEAGITQKVPDSLLGYPIVINQDMPVPAANAKSILFGAFHYAYKIRDVMDVTMFRFTDSAYTKNGQVGFLAWSRSGGNCVDTTAIKYYQNSAT
jgi:HK97 family phage major capsid protein